MQDAVCSTQKPRKWYNDYIFPLVPIFGTRKADEHNASSWWFHWLFIRIWSMDSVGFEISFVMDGHWGIGFNGNLPYVRWVLCIPCPPKLSRWSMENLWRKSPQQKRDRKNYQSCLIG